jgi:hypothetical protein
MRLGHLAFDMKDQLGDQHYSDANKISKFLYDQGERVDSILSLKNRRENVKSFSNVEQFNRFLPSWSDCEFILAGMNWFCKNYFMMHVAGIWIDALTKLKKGCVRLVKKDIVYSTVRYYETRNDPHWFYFNEPLTMTVVLAEQGGVSENGLQILRGS